MRWTWDKIDTSDIAAQRNLIPWDFLHFAFTNTNILTSGYALNTYCPFIRLTIGTRLTHTVDAQMHVKTVSGSRTHTVGSRHFLLFLWGKLKMVRNNVRSLPVALTPHTIYNFVNWLFNYPNVVCAACALRALELLYGCELWLINYFYIVFIVNLLSPRFYDTNLFRTVRSVRLFALNVRWHER